MRLTSRLRKSNPISTPTELSPHGRAELRDLVGADSVPIAPTPTSPATDRVPRRAGWLAPALAVVLTAAFVLTGVAIWRGNQPGSPGGQPTPVVSTTLIPPVQPSSSSEPTPQVDFIPPHGTAVAGWIEISTQNAAADTPVVDLHIDYQCPQCKIFNSAYGALLQTLADRGDIVLRIHLRTFLDGMLNNDSSTQAAVAATCADTVGSFSAYHQTVLAHSPIEGTGFTDQQLRVDFAAEAGITGTALASFQTCYDTGETLSYVQAMEQVNATSTTVNDGVSQDAAVGVPALYVNGTGISMDTMLTDSGWKTAATASPDALLAHLIAAS